jgi:hypothetical protein
LKWHEGRQKSKREGKKTMARRQAEEQEGRKTIGAPRAAQKAGSSSRKLMSGTGLTIPDPFLTYT